MFSIKGREYKQLLATPPWLLFATDSGAQIQFVDHDGQLTPPKTAKPPSRKKNTNLSGNCKDLGWRPLLSRLEPQATMFVASCALTSMVRLREAACLIFPDFGGSEEDRGFRSEVMQKQHSQMAWFTYLRSLRFFSTSGMSTVQCLRQPSLACPSARRCP